MIDLNIKNVKILPLNKRTIHDKIIIQTNGNQNLSKFVWTNLPEYLK